jgi:hypothetical protein
MSKLVIHRPRLARIQADITTKKKIYETVLKYSVVVVGGGVAKANFVCNPIIFEGKEPIQNFRLIGQPILG